MKPPRFLITWANGSQVSIRSEQNAFDWALSNSWTTPFQCRYSFQMQFHHRLFFGCPGYIYMLHSTLTQDTWHQQHFFIFPTTGKRCSCSCRYQYIELSCFHKCNHKNGITDCSLEYSINGASRLILLSRQWKPVLQLGVGRGANNFSP